jgi:hypothetical protein
MSDGDCVPAVAPDTEAYQRLLDIAARADPSEAIRQGLEDSNHGMVRPAREFFAEFEVACHLSRDGKTEAD